MANKVYTAEETSITWADDTNTPDYTLDLGGLAADGVRVGDIGDLGAAPRSLWYRWELHIDGFDTAPVVGQLVSAYLSFSVQASAGREWGDVGVVDGAGATDDLPNLLPLDSTSVQTTTAADELITGGIVLIPYRYVIPVVHNDTDDALLSTSDYHRFILTPIPPEIQ